MKIVFLDLETTGLAPESNYILTGSFSLCNYETLEEEDALEIGIKPQFARSVWDNRMRSAENIHRLSYDDCLQFSPTEEAAPKIFEFLARADIICSHAKFYSFGKSYYFDHAFLKEFYRCQEKDWPNLGEESTHTWAVYLAQHNIIDNNSSFDLASLSDYFSIKLEDHHNAQSDRRALQAIYKHLREAAKFTTFKRYSFRSDNDTRNRIRSNGKGLRLLSTKKKCPIYSGIQPDFFGTP